jgi:hypothetical protein
MWCNYLDIVDAYQGSYKVQGCASLRSCPSQLEDMLSAQAILMKDQAMGR